jgi:hypothetical protein
MKAFRLGGEEEAGLATTVMGMALSVFKMPASVALHCSSHETTFPVRTNDSAGRRPTSFEQPAALTVSCPLHPIEAAIDFLIGVSSLPTGVGMLRPGARGKPGSP